MNYEFGVFYINKDGKQEITGANQKHFPKAVGDGRRTLGEVVKDEYYYTDRWEVFLKNHDLSEVLKEGEVRKLSFVGSHTLGTGFTDGSDKVTKEVEEKLFEVFSKTPGFNFGRADIKAKTLEDFQSGNFKLIEVNGIASIPTHIFDPKYSVFKAFKVLFKYCLLYTSPSPRD